MNRYLISAAVLALLAGSAFAQPDDHRGGDHPGGGHERGGAAPAAAPAAAAPAAAPPNHAGNPFNRPQLDPNRNAPRTAAPAAAPQAARDNRGGNNGGNMGFAGVNHALVGDPRNDNNHGNRTGMGHPGNGPDAGRPGNGLGRPGNTARPGTRPDFSQFRDYHRTFSAPHRFRAPSYQRPSGWSYHRWSYGDFLPSLFWGQQYWLNDFNDYDLPPPPPGTTWVRYGNDALLIDRYTGEIITVEYSVFY